MELKRGDLSPHSWSVRANSAWPGHAHLSLWPWRHRREQASHAAAAADCIEGMVDSRICHVAGVISGGRVTCR